MRKIILYIAASIDGYIAKEDGGVDWLEDIDPTSNPNEDYGYGEFIQNIDTTIQGNATYQQVIGWDIPFPYKGYKNYVITTNTLKTSDENAEFISSDFENFFSKLKQQEGKDIWLIGGGKVNTLFLELGLIDEIIITQFPIILGKGKPLFTTTDKEQKLKLEKVIQYENGLTQMSYTIE